MLIPICGWSQNVSDGKPCSKAPTVTDYDKNVYKTVQIGEQCWMKENLKTTKYADGTPINQGIGYPPQGPTWRYPLDKSSYKASYGLLYDWKTVMHNSSPSNDNPSGVQGICPIGWHVPSIAEWTELVNYASSLYQCGYDNKKIAKVLASTKEWETGSEDCAVGNNPSSNNALGFEALPAGANFGSHADFGYAAFFWSSTNFGTNQCLYPGNVNLNFCFSHVKISNETERNSDYYYYSVRCILDDPEKIAALEEAKRSEAQRIEDAKRAEAQKNIKEVMDKFVSLSASKFDIKLFGADVCIHTDYDNNYYFWSKHIASKTDMRTQLGTKLKPFFPIDSYVINELKDDMCICTIEKFIKKGQSEFWKTKIKFTEEGLIDLDASFDFANSEKVVTE